MSDYDQRVQNLHGDEDIRDVHDLTSPYYPHSMATSDRASPSPTRGASASVVTHGGREVAASVRSVKKEERKLEEKRVRAVEKMENEIAKAHQKAEERRASAEAKRGGKIARVLEVANLMKAWKSHRAADYSEMNRVDRNRGQGNMHGEQVHSCYRTRAQNKWGNGDSGQARQVNELKERMGNLDEEQSLIHEHGGLDNAIDEDVDEQPVQDLALNVDNVFQADDCDAYDSDVDDAPTAQTLFMGNLYIRRSSYV
ncbi:integrase, catalytic region, zinc finger, CCHC-type containing protein [Tanacetum coccineum]|uniref:Integrase, catalytic region, zinc finger, CCHC-type containing protein n=1 Tax=Tanacetum coccineum TaxID=301880 RepID=A0ABQ4XJJ6_9ASTR